MYLGKEKCNPEQARNGAVLSTNGFDESTEIGENEKQIKTK